MNITKDIPGILMFFSSNNTEDTKNINVKLETRWTSMLSLYEFFHRLIEPFSALLARLHRLNQLLVVR